MKITVITLLSLFAFAAHAEDTATLVRMDRRVPELVFMYGANKVVTLSCAYTWGRWEPLRMVTQDSRGRQRTSRPVLETHRVRRGADGYLKLAREFYPATTYDHCVTMLDRLAFQMHASKKTVVEVDPEGQLLITPNYDKLEERIKASPHAFEPPGGHPQPASASR